MFALSAAVYAKFSRRPVMAKGGGSASRPHRGAKRGRGSSHYGRGGRGGRSRLSTQELDDRRPDSAVDDEGDETASGSGSESGDEVSGPGEWTWIWAHARRSSYIRH